MKFSDIPQLTKIGSWEASYSLSGFVEHINSEIKEGLILNPDFQRGHVWTEEQQIKFIEYYLMGGETGTIYLNAPHWPYVSPNDYDYVCVDGLQRITAFSRFYNNEIKAFGHYYKEFDDRLSLVSHGITLNINNLKTRKEVLQWYLEMNGGGTPHTKEELDRVKNLLEQER